MRTIGFVKSDKENENRIAILPCDAKKIKNIDYVYIEEGYGLALNISDDEYLKVGCRVVSHLEALSKDIIVDPKIGDAQFLRNTNNKTIFGWIHAVQNREITDILINNKITAYAWEDMFEYGRHVFWRNNEIAGEAAVMHAILLHGIMPYDANIAIIGNGNTARGAYRVLTQLGANVKVYSRKMEELLRKEIMDYDIIVNCILWDVNRNDHIIYRDDLKRMKKGSIIIDVSCDRNAGIETSIPTTIDNPTYCVDGIVHYAVDHTPALVFKTVSIELSKSCWKYIDQLITDNADETLLKSKIIENGMILDERINKFQNR